MENWRPIENAPADRDLQLAVIENGQVYALVFACRRKAGGWANASGKLVDVNPTHWRYWEEFR